MATIADLIHRVLVGREDDAELAAVPRRGADALLQVRRPTPISSQHGVTPSPVAPPVRLRSRT